MIGRALDASTQAWVRLTGRTLTVPKTEWIDGPTGDQDVVGDTWLSELAAAPGRTRRTTAGLIQSFEKLSGPSFDPSAVRPAVIDFYERTSEYRLDVWSQWSAAMWPGGWLVTALFARRLEQLALPLRPLEVAHGMDSTVVAIDDIGGTQLGAAWLRTIRSTGRPIYSGYYGITRIPGCNGPVVRVVFPLPRGSCTVLLAPRNGPNGSLILESPLGSFGSPGAYLVVRRAHDRARVRRIPIAETFRVFVDDDGALRTDHHMTLWNATVIRLHYRMTPSDRQP